MKNFWEEIFYKEGSGFRDEIFRISHKDIPKFIRLLKKINAKNILDLGCGTGRHMVALAKSGFRVYGIDMAEKAVRVTKERMRQGGLRADLKVGDIYKKLPYEENFFDGVISIKVLHHARISQIKKLIKEIERVMRLGGILMIEVPKKDCKRQSREDYKEIEPGTFIPIEGPEKEIPHHIFANKDELKTFFPHFEILDIRLTGRNKKGTPSLHYTMFAKLKESS